MEMYFKIGAIIFFSITVKHSIYGFSSKDKINIDKWDLLIGYFDNLFQYFELARWNLMKWQ